MITPAELTEIEQAQEARWAAKGVRKEIEDGMASLPPDALKPWVSLDKLPYIHATNALKAHPCWTTPVVGRFDYLETMRYMLACQPSNIRALLSQHDKEKAELEERVMTLTELIKNVNASAVGGLCSFTFAGAREFLKDIKALSTTQGR